jgi:hypothetical protein
VFTICGCAANENKNEIIEESKKISLKSIPFENEEYSILRAAGANHSMIFSINLGRVNANKIKYWIDHYENGKLTGTIFNLESQISNESEHMDYKLYFSISDSASNQERWTLALRQHGNVSSGSYDMKDIDFDSTGIQPIADNSINLNKNADLGMIIRNKGKNQFTSSDDVKATINENKDVYVIRCGFN